MVFIHSRSYKALRHPVEKPKADDKAMVSTFGYMLNVCAITYHHGMNITNSAKLFEIINIILRYLVIT
jgi:hypothetical protein